MTPLERACAAVVDNLREQGDLMDDCGAPEWAQVDGAFRVEPVVRAVLAAIRQPSEEMVDAGLRSNADLGWNGPAMCWGLMIDAALAEEI